MIFNRSNVKVIKENGYLSKYVGKTAPYFPFTIDDAINNMIILKDDTYLNGKYFYLLSYVNNNVYFISFRENGSGEYIIGFNYQTYNISFNSYSWSNN